MTKYCSMWLIFALLFVLESAYWYSLSLPEEQKLMIFKISPEIKPFFKIFIWSSPIIFIMGILLALKISGSAKRYIAFGLIIIGFSYMASFEWIREAGRRPYIIHNYMYSNSVLVKDLDKIKKDGILKYSEWAKASPDTGKELFKLLCASCHSIGGPLNNIYPVAKGFSEDDLMSLFDSMGQSGDYMPPFPGNKREKEELAKYISQELIK